MDKLIKYRKRFVDFCFSEGYDIKKIRGNKKITVYECTKAEAWRWGPAFVIHIADDTDISLLTSISHYLPNKKTSHA